MTTTPFLDRTQPFKNWKEKKGIRTRIVTKTELINSNPPYYLEWIADPLDDGNYTGIDKYIKDAYDEWGSQALTGASLPARKCVMARLVPGH